MFHLNSSLHCESASWDTNFARTYLQISEDQLEKINKIPGWSKTEISKISSKNDNTLNIIEKQLTGQASTSTENLLPTKINISVKDILKSQNDTSDLQFKQIPVTPLMEKEVFLKNVSLSPIKKKYTLSDSLQRSSSLPDLYEGLLSPRKSVKINRKKVSIEDLSNVKLSPVLTEYPNQLPKHKSKTLDDILNDTNLKDIEKSLLLPFSSKGAVKIAFQQEMSLLEKKLLLLERRFSPSKEISAPQFSGKLLSVGNLNDLKNIPSQILTPVDKLVTTVESSNSVEILDEIENSSLSKSYKSLQLQSNSQPSNEKCDATKNTLKSVEDNSGNVPKTTVLNFESFLSPPVPCGQLVTTEVVSLSRPISSENSAKLNTPNVQIASPPGSHDQPQSIKVHSPSQPVPSKKCTKLKTSHQLQNIELSATTLVPEKSSGAFNAFSANSNEKVLDLASDKELSSKRKRRNKSERSSKKFDGKKLKRGDIHFSSVQISSMIEIMKIFHTEL